MYSDNHFEDLAFDAHNAGQGSYMHTGATFDLPDFGLNTELFSDSIFPNAHNALNGGINSNPLSQTVQRNSHDVGAFHFPGRSDIGQSNSALVGSPQPGTIKKLKSHLSGIGGVGGYLTSPVVRGQQSGSTSTGAGPGQTLHHRGDDNQQLGSSPLKPLRHGSQQQVQCFDVDNSALPPMPRPSSAQGLSSQQHQQDQSNYYEPQSQQYAAVNQLSAPGMQRYQSAPATSSMSIPQASTSATIQTCTTGQGSSVNHGNLDLPESKGITPFTDLDYGGMRIYGRPLNRSVSEDPSASSSHNEKAMKSAQKPNAANSSFLPYPERLPTNTLGRGVKNSRDLQAPVAHSSFPMAKAGSEPLRPVTAGAMQRTASSAAHKRSIQNIDKPFVQYVPPHSPAAKSARNKKSLTVKTNGSATLSPSPSPESKKQSGKLVPIRMTQAMPLTPPVSGGNSGRTSPMQHRSPDIRVDNPQSYNQYEQQGEQYPCFSTTTNASDYMPIQSQPNQYANTNVPSFEFSLEQFGEQANTVGGYSQSDSGSNTIQNYLSSQQGGQSPLPTGGIDFASVLGLPSPHAYSSASMSNHGGSSNGLLSPPPHSATSTHSSVFSEDQMFGVSTTPLFEESQSIDQALASLLGSQQSASGQQSQMQMHAQQVFSPNHAQQAQQNMGWVSSPPYSPQHATATSPAQSTWAPYTYQQQTNESLSNYDPAMRPMQQDNGYNNGLLSPQSAHFQPQYQDSFPLTANNGRPMSSPRRLRGMKSAPDLGVGYSDGFKDAFGITSPSPRKVSLKRGRTNNYAEDSDQENDDGGMESNARRYEGSSSDPENEDDEYDPDDSHDRPPPRKRSNSVVGNRLFSPSKAAPSSPAAVLQSLVNPNPARLRPGPKPKTSLPNLQAVRQNVFQVSPRAPPVPAFPVQYLATSPAPSGCGDDPAAVAGVLSPDPETGYLKPQGGISKDMLATFYSVGAGSRQTKKGKPQRMYLCSIPGCGKEFPRKSAVESHIQTHLEDKPFACPYDACGASFVRAHDLTRHVRIHSGSKPFQCVCGKGFARGDALTRHRQRGICEGSLVPRRW